MKKVKFVFITLFLIVCFGINIYAVQPNDRVYIYDKASILEEETKIELTRRLAKLYDETFADIRIFTIETLHNQSIVSRETISLLNKGNKSRNAIIFVVFDTGKMKEEANPQLTENFDITIASL